MILDLRFANSRELGALDAVLTPARRKSKKLKEEKRRMLIQNKSQDFFLKSLSRFQKIFRLQNQLKISAFQEPLELLFLRAMDTSCDGNVQ